MRPLWQSCRRDPPVRRTGGVGEGRRTRPRLVRRPTGAHRHRRPVRYREGPPMTRQSSSHRLRRRESCARRCGCQPSGRRVRWRHPGALPETTGSCARRSKTSVVPMFMSLHRHHHRSMTTSSNCCCCWTLAAGARAARVTAVVPNFGYAPKIAAPRQARPSARGWLPTRSPQQGPTGSSSSIRTHPAWKHSAESR